VSFAAAHIRKRMRHDQCGSGILGLTVSCYEIGPAEKSRDDRQIAMARQRHDAGAQVKQPNEYE